MTNSLKVLLSICLLVVASGCGDDAPPPATDAGDVDMGTVDVDMGTVDVDMGTVDVDMGTVDVDMGTVDMGTVDMGDVDGAAG
jgi:hypothetical protein